MNSKAKAIICTMAVALSLGTAVPASADYPPVQDVKPSTVVKELAYDRTPASVAASTRKVETNVAPGEVKSVKVFIGEVFTPVVPNCPPATKFRVTVTAADGRTVTLPAVKSLDNGRLRLPTIAITKAGSYTAKVTAPNGKVRTIRINVGK